MKWPMWYAHIDGYVHKVGNTKDDLISFLMGGHSTDNYAWGRTKVEAIELGKAIFGDEWEVEE